MAIYNQTFASNTDGVIDSTYKYAWGENIGWINFGATNGNVHVTDSGLSGYALSENAGWISLSGVVNDSEGNLSGLAWSENAGWIKFDPINGGVHINSLGEFTGSALGENIGWIIFGGDYKVKTDWRPRSARPTITGNSRVGGGHPPTTSFINTPIIPPLMPILQSAIVTPVATIANSVSKITSSVSNSVLNFFKPEGKEPAETKIIIQVPKNTPIPFNTKWNVLPTKAIQSFVFAPLPKTISNLAQKFPELGKTFKDVGINKISDLQKLKNAKFALSGLNSKVGLSGGAMIQISSLTKSQKSLIPSEVIFAKAGKLIDYSMQLTIDKTGAPEQSITTIAGKSLNLVIKEDKPINSIKGYIVVKKIDRQQAKRISVPADSMLAVPVMASLGTVYPDNKEIKIEEKLVVGKFDYSDENKDGIYTASIASPLVAGEYEIISIIDYKDPSLGKKELKLVTVVDPEGYIYKKNGNDETRISNAKVSLYWKNPENSNFEIWKAKDYQQINPQKTDKSGTYSFLVPEGTYKFSVSSKGYYDYKSDEFEVEEGRGVHENIELSPKSWWRSLFGLFK